jgi:hypothetical protein
MATDTPTKTSRELIKIALRELPAVERELITAEEIASPELADRIAETRKHLDAFKESLFSLTAAAETEAVFGTFGD